MFTSTSIGHTAARGGIALLLGAFLAVLLALPFAVPAHAVAPHVLSVSFQPTGTACTEVLAKGPSNVTAIAADRTNSIVVCAHVEDAATGTDQSQVPVELRVTVGALGASGTSKYSGIVFSSSAGISQISYRGDGASHGTDTVVATYSAGNAVAVASIEVTPPTGRVPDRMVILEPAERAIAADEATAGGYVSPARGALVAVQVQDAAGRGVNGQPLVVTSTRGALVANPAFAQSAATLCAGATSRVLALTTTETDVLAPGGQPRPGLANFVVCASSNIAPGTASDAGPGEVLLTVEHLAQPLPPVTLTLHAAARPASIAPRVEDGRLAALVTDDAGRPVADGTPVRFVIAPSAGVVASACVLTRGGEARVTVGLDVSEAVVLVSAEYAASGTAATCAAPGAHRVHASAAVSREALTLAAAP